MIYSIDLTGRVTHFTFRLDTTCSIEISLSTAYFVFRRVEGRQYTMLPTASRMLDSDSLHRRRFATSSDVARTL